MINERRKETGQQLISPVMFRGSAGVSDPEKQMVVGRKNKDYFMNLKAQSWWSLRQRFEETYNAVVYGRDYRADEIISISSSIKQLNKLTMELSQSTWDQNSIGKILINKSPDGMRSPNLADAVMMAFAPINGGLWSSKLNQSEINKI